MAHSLSAQKRIRQNKKSQKANKSKMSAAKTAEKKVLEAVEAKDVDMAHEMLRRAMKKIDKAAKANVIHKNTAARKKSRLHRLVNQLGEGEV